MSDPVLDQPGSSPLLTFRLELQPTDPAWNKEQHLRLTGAVAVPYPAPGSFSLAMAESSDLTPDVCTVLDRIIAAEALGLSSSTRRAAAPPHCQHFHIACLCPRTDATRECTLLSSSIDVTSSTADACFNKYSNPIASYTPTSWGHLSARSAQFYELFDSPIKDYIGMTGVPQQPGVHAGQGWRPAASSGPFEPSSGGSKTVLGK